jgi:hypothetical protein
LLQILDIGQLDLHFFGGRRSLASFNYILLTRASGLHHLINSTVALFEMALTEPIGYLINNLGFLIGE